MNSILPSSSKYPPSHHKIEIHMKGNISRYTHKCATVIIFMPHKKWHLLSPPKSTKRGRKKECQETSSEYKSDERASGKCECFFYARCDIVNGGKLKMKLRKYSFGDSDFAREKNIERNENLRIINFGDEEKKFSSVHIFFLLNHVHWFRKHIIK